MNQQNDHDKPHTKNNNKTHTKNHKDEDFIVLSPFFKKADRKKVKEFYNIARKADDVADSPILSCDEKLSILTEMKKDIENPHLLQLFQAFELDAKEEVDIQNYEDLLNYSKLSACPVADFLLDLFHEDKDKISPFTHDLAISFQILNHIKDYQKDLRENNRTYLPKEWLESYDVNTVIEHLIVRVSQMLVNASKSSYHIKSKRLKFMVELCLAYGFRHLKKLRKSINKVSTKDVRLSKLNKIQAIGKGLYNYVSSINKYSRDQRVVTRVCKTASSSFYVGMKKAPKYNRMGIYALYALFRTLDDIADDLFTSKEYKIAELHKWQDKIYSIYDGTYNGQILSDDEVKPCEILKVLAPYIREFNLPKSEFKYMFDGMFFDVNLSHNQLLSTYQVDKYCRHVACSAGVLVMYILGVQTPLAKKFAIRLGYALQLINILRDIDVDVHLKRIYISQEKLDKYSITYTNIPDSDNFYSLRRDLILQIEEQLRSVKILLSEFKKSGHFKQIRSTIIMMNTYEELFKNIQDQHKIDKRLSLLQKIKIVIRMFTL